MAEMPRANKKEIPEMLDMVQRQIQGFKYDTNSVEE